MKRTKLFFVLLMAALLAALAVPTLPTHAASNGSISFDGTGDAASTTCDDADLDYSGSVLADTDDGGGRDWIAIVTEDGNGNALDVDFLGVPATGEVYSSTASTNMGMISSITARPIRLYLYDIGNPGSIDENTAEGAAFSRSGKLLAWDVVDPAGAVSACASLPVVGYAGVPVPSGFALYTINCETAVYDAPAGGVVGSNVIHAGQTWFINPTPEAGPDGQNWTQIFVNGSKLGFVPTSCVGGPVY
jgi:hypothetical protein